jgi:hypothetical protein
MKSSHDDHIEAEQVFLFHLLIIALIITCRFELLKVQVTMAETVDEGKACAALRI